MGQDRLVGASCVLEGISQDWHKVKGSIIIDGLGDHEHVGRETGEVHCHRMEGIPDNFAEEWGG